MSVGEGHSDRTTELPILNIVLKTLKGLLIIAPELSLN
jgi:hypothetical protein